MLCLRGLGSSGSLLATELLLRHVLLAALRLEEVRGARDSNLAKVGAVAILGGVVGNSLVSAKLRKKGIMSAFCFTRIRLRVYWCRY